VDEGIAIERLGGTPLKTGALPLGHTGTGRAAVRTGGGLAADFLVTFPTS
jgi:hypothetical protein